MGVSTASPINKEVKRSPIILGKSHSKYVVTYKILTNLMKRVNIIYVLILFTIQRQSTPFSKLSKFLEIADTDNLFLTLLTDNCAYSHLRFSAKTHWHAISWNKFKLLDGLFS